MVLTEKVNVIRKSHSIFTNRALFGFPEAPSVAYAEIGPKPTGRLS